MPSLSEIQIGRRGFVTVAGIGLASALLGGRARAQEPVTVPEGNKVFFTHISAGQELSPEEIDAQRLAAFKQSMREIVGVTPLLYSPNIHILAPNGLEDTFDGRSEFLAAAPEFITIVKTMIAESDAKRSEHQYPTWKPSNENARSVSLHFIELSATAGASRYTDDANERKEIYVQEGSVWELMRYFAELVIPNANLNADKKAFFNADPVREAAVREMTQYLVREYQKYCIEQAQLNLPVNMIQVRNQDGVLISPTLDEYINAIQDEVNAWTTPTTPVDNVLPQRQQQNPQTGELEPYFGTYALYYSNAGTLTGKAALYESLVRSATRIVDEEVARWLSAGNSFNGNEAIFRMRIEKYFQGKELPENDIFEAFKELDEQMGWRDMILAIEQRLREAGLVVPRDEYFPEVEVIEDLMWQDPAVLQFTAIGNIGSTEGFRIKVAQLLTDHASGRVSVRQNQVTENGLQPEHCPDVDAAFSVFSPARQGMTWVVVPAQSVTITGIDECSAVFYTSFQFVDIDGTVQQVNLSGIVPAKLRLRQKQAKADGTQTEYRYEDQANFSSSAALANETASVVGTVITDVEGDWD